MAVQIRRINPEQWQALRDVRLRSLLDAPGAFGQRYEDAAATPDAEWQSIANVSSTGDRRVWFIAWGDDGTPVGVVQARRRPPTDCMLFSMWVAPEARGSRVGAELVNAVDDWAGTWGGRRIVLWVIATNDGASRFYERIGFTVLEDGPDADSGREYGAVAMVRSRNGQHRPRADPSASG